MKRPHRTVGGTSTVNDWMVYLNANYGQKLPVLPSRPQDPGLPDVVTALWNLTINMATPTAPPLPSQVPILGTVSATIPGGGTIALKNLALDLTPTTGACGIEGTLAYTGRAGPVSITLTSTNVVAFASAQFSFGALKLSDVWQVLHAVFNDASLGFPNLPEGIWSFLDKNLILPTVWLPPSFSGLSSYFELQFQTPPSIAGNIGGVSAGNFKYSIEPNILISTITVSYTEDSGLQLNTKVSIDTYQAPTAPPPPGPAALDPPAGTPKTELVGFPPNLPAQDIGGILGLTYLGIGQRVGPQTGVDPNATDPLAKIFQELEGLLQGSDVASLLQTVAKTFYQPDRNWFVAADFVLFNSFELRVLINDPAFYGLEITASGSNPVWKGFLFEILYEKISSNLGAFYGALTLPDDMRYIPLDGFVLVLPGFSIWIYTNGDFRINVGWPIGSNSIGILIGPLQGLAGFYVEKLRSADFPGARPTANYNPILGQGVGVQVSITESVDIGIFSGGWYVGVGATFQGLIAWLDQSGFAIDKPPDHYWFAGTANLSILVWGDVDFGVVQASVSASLSAGVGVAFEKGYGTLIAVQASISASASIKIGFVHIHFNFNTSIRQTFGIGGSPYASVSGPLGMGIPAQIRRIETLRARSSFPRQLALMELNKIAEQPRDSSAALTGPIDVMFVLHPTAVYSGSSGQVNLVASLAVGCPAVGPLGAPPGPTTQFERLVRQLIAWLMSQTTQTDNISARLQRIKNNFLGSAGSDPPVAGAMLGFVNALKAYLQANVSIRINPPPSAAIEVEAALLPMFDVLTLQPNITGVSPINFGTYNVTPDNYTTAVRCYYQDLRATAFVNSNGNGSLIPPRAPVQNWSMATWAFGDYFLLLSRHIVSELYAAALYYEEKQPGADADTELAGLIDAFDFASAAGIGSRFMLHGAQLPQPDKIPVNPSPENMATVATSGLYVLTGQQFAVPQSALGPGPTTTISASLSLSSTSSWITFSSGSSVSTSIPVPNTVPAAPTPAWLIYQEDQPIPPPTGDQIAVAPLPAVVPQNLVFGLTTLVNWVLPSANYTIYPLPEPLCDLATKYNSIQLKLQIDGDQDPLKVGSSTPAPTPVKAKPALLIRLSVTKISNQTSSGSAAQSGASAYIPFVYQLNAADEATRELIYRALLDSTTLATAGLTLLYTKTGSGTAALQSDNLSSLVLLAKNNLSVENQIATVSGIHAHMLAAITAPQQPDSAPLSDPVNFLRLVWEQCVVNAPGFLLYYETTDGKGLPDDIFVGSSDGNPISGSGGPTAQFDILVEFQSGTAVQNQVKSYMNCMVVEAPPPAGQTNQIISAYVFDDAGTAMQSYAPSYPPGTIGIEFLWSPPGESSPPPLVPVDQLYQLIQYQIVGANGFDESVWSLPVGPADHLIGPPDHPAPDDLWSYKQVIPILKFLPEGGLPTVLNPYAVIGSTVELGFQTSDIYGNSLPSSQTASFPCRYNDPLISIGHWPGVHTSYMVSGTADPATLAITLHFDPRILQPPPSDDAATYWNRLRRRYRQILDQLTDPNTVVAVTSSLAGGGSIGVPTAIQAALTRFVSDILTAIPNPPTRPVAGSVNDCILNTQVHFASIVALTSDIFEVTVSIAFTRTNDNDIDPDANNLQDGKVKQVSHLVSAQTTGQGSRSTDGNSGIAIFAAQFESAFSKFDGQTGKLKIAQRLGIFSGVAGSPSLGLWAVRFSTDAGIVLAPPADTSKIGYFALAPLSATPVSGTHTSLVPGVSPSHTTYTNIDLDLWAEQFLRAFDALLVPQMAAAIAILDQKNGTANYKQLTDLKRQLAKTIATGVESIFNTPPTGSPTEARAALEQAMLTELSSAYGVSTIVQVPTTVAVAGQADGSGTVPQFLGRLGPPPPAADSAPPVVQPYALSNPTLDVAAGQQYLTSLLTVQTQQPTQIQSATPYIELPLQYQITHLQHDFETAETYFGYVPSSWLKFALPALPNDPQLVLSIPQPGTSVEIPVPVPYLPTTPTLQTQTAVGADGAPSGSTISDEIRDALYWDYDVTLSADLIPEDSLYFDVTYNPAAASARARLSAGGLFDALAEYQEHYPSAAELGQIVTEAFGSGSGSAQSLIARASRIVQGVVQAWPSQLDARRRRIATSAATVTDHFNMTAKQNGSNLTVTLFGQSATATPPNHWPSQIVLPNATEPWVVDSSTAQPSGDWYKITATLPYAAPSSANSTTELTWTDLDILDEQSAAFRCWVQRNSNLADVIKAAVNPDFILITQQATFSTPAIPLIERQTLSTIVPTTLSLDDILTQILQPLANVNGAVVDLQCSYSYALVQATSSRVTVPRVGASTTFIRPTQVTIRPDPASIPSLASGIAAEIRSMYDENPLPQTGAALHIGLSLSGNQSGSNTLLAQFYDIPIDVSSIAPGWL